MKGEYLDMKTPAIKEVIHSWEFIKMDPSSQTVLVQRRNLGRDPVGLSQGLPAPVRTSMQSSQAEDLELLHPVTVTARERERLTGAKILNCMESGGAEEPGKRQLQEVEVAKTVVQERRKRGKVLNTALRKKVKNLSGVTTKT